MRLELFGIMMVCACFMPFANAQGQISWNHTVYPPNSSGTVEIVDRDRSLNPLTITTFQTSAWSDSDLSGIQLEMVETAPNSGVFLGNVYFSTNYPSSGNRLHVSVGDTVTAEYIDRTPPPPYLDTQELVFKTTALILANSSKTLGSQSQPSANQTIGRIVSGTANGTAPLYLDPLKQFKSGIPPGDVKCKQGLRLVIKAENNTPACVTPTSAAKLLERGWAKNPN